MSKKLYRNSRDRFIGVAEARTNVILEKIRILGNCSNKQLYQYSPEEVNKIFKAIDEQLLHTKQKFIAQSKSTRKKFNL